MGVTAVTVLLGPRRGAALLPPKMDADVTPGIGPLEDDGLSRWAEVTRMPTTLVDWTRLYRACGLRRTEEYHGRILINLQIRKKGSHVA